MIAEPWYKDPEWIRSLSRWYVANVIFRPKDEHGVPISKDMGYRPEIKTALIDSKRFWDTYIGISEYLANPNVSG